MLGVLLVVLLAQRCWAQGWWYAPHPAPAKNGLCTLKYSVGITVGVANRPIPYADSCVRRDTLTEVWSGWFQIPRPREGCFAVCGDYAYGRHVGQAALFVDDVENMLCWCGGLVASRDVSVAVCPPSTLTVREVPLGCLWLPEADCTANATENGCAFVDGCCVDAADVSLAEAWEKLEYREYEDNKDGGYDSPSEYRHTVLVMFCIVCVVAVPIRLLCSYKARPADTDTAAAAAGDPQNPLHLQAPWLRKDDAVAAVVLALRALRVTKYCPPSAAPSPHASCMSLFDPEGSCMVTSGDREDVHTDNASLLYTMGSMPPPAPLRIGSLQRPPSRHSSRSRSGVFQESTPGGQNLDASVSLAITVAPPSPSSVPSARCCPVCLDSEELEHEAGDADTPTLEVLSAASRKLDDTPLPGSGWGTLDCGHSLHVVCIRDWFIQQAKKDLPPSCPICRALAGDVQPPKVIHIDAGGRGVTVVVTRGDSMACFLRRAHIAMGAAGLVPPDCDALPAAAFGFPVEGDRPYDLVDAGGTLTFAQTFPAPLQLSRALPVAPSAAPLLNH